MAFTEDISQFFSTSDFAVAATIDGATVNGIFDAEYIDALDTESSRPMLTVESADIEELDNNIIVNGTFSSGDNWTSPTTDYWTFANNRASFPGGVAFESLEQLTPDVSIGDENIITFTVLDYVAGSINFSFGNGGPTSTSRTANGTYAETLEMGGLVSLIRFHPSSDFQGSITGVKIQQSLTAAHGSVVVVNGTTYAVVNIQPDGTGVTVLYLEEQ